MLKLKQIILIILSLMVCKAYAEIAQTYMTVPNHGKLSLNQATLIKSLKSDAVVHFKVWLKLRNKEQLDQLVREIYDPKSPNYRKFLTDKEFSQQYAPALDTENAVLQYFTSQGMQAKIVNHSVRVTATVRQIEKVFNVKMNYYHYKGRTVFANSAAPQLRSDIAQYISEISGLNNIIKIKPALRERPKVNVDQKSVKPHDFNLVWDSFTPFAQPTTTSFVGFTGQQLQTTYNIANIAPVGGVTLDGSGQTLVIIDVCGGNSPDKIEKDANDYNKANGLTKLSASNFKVINPDGSTFTTCPATDEGWNKEIALDVESSHTIAPGAKTVLVLAQADTDLDGAIIDVVSTLTTSNYTIGGFTNAYVVSNSWGYSETEGPSPGTETSLEKAAAFGISFDFSSMDCGDGTYSSSWTCTAEGAHPTVQYPASSSYTTAVGGSSLFVDNNWNYSFEALWGSYYDGAFYAGSTGGISQLYGPVAWQGSINSFTAGGYTAGTVGSYNKRAVPDVAMLADPYTGLTIYENGNIFVYGGTSLSCPLFSGTVTLLNQARTLLNGGTPNPIGQVAPYLYMNNSALRNGQALNLIAPPHSIIDGAVLPPNGAPLSAFSIYDSSYNYVLTFGWDSSLTIAPENQFWNDGVGVGSPNLPNFLTLMAQF